MIKGTYFSKYLKLFLFGFGISCFMGLGNSVNAYTSGESNLMFKEFNLGTFVDLSYGPNTNTFISDGALNFDSNVNGSTFDNQFLALFDTVNGSYHNKLYHSLGFINGQLYYYGKYKCPASSCDSTYQGFFTKICKVAKGDYFSCTQSTSNFIDISSFYNLDGRFRKGYFISAPYNTHNKSYLCFEDDYNDYCLSFGAYSSDGYQLTGSLNYNITDIDGFKTIPYGASDFKGLQVEGISTPYCRTIKEIMFSMGSSYNTGLCYSDNFTMSGMSLVNKPSQFIMDIFSDYNSYTSSIDKYYSYCTAPATQETCGNAFNSQIDAYQVVSKIIRSGLPQKEVRNYCYMSTLDPNSTNCVASGGGVKEPYTNEDYINMVSDGEYTVLKPGTGTIFDWATKQGTSFNGDILSTIKDLWIRFSSLFKLQTGNTSGSLPGYILSFLFIIILFKLFKK